MNTKISEKQQKTVERMKLTRYNDYVNLRDLAEKRIDWIKIEKEKAIKGIEDLKIQLARLEGAEIVLNELLKKKVIEEETKNG